MNPWRVFRWGLMAAAYIAAGFYAGWKFAAWTFLAWVAMMGLLHLAFWLGEKENAWERRSLEP